MRCINSNKTVSDNYKSKLQRHFYKYLQGRQVTGYTCCVQN
uniref:Uncharacterized protein n=1 Tax=Anguilla anguilla TaxID=7936 RepID=A0A0E9XIW1_ANGAN